MTDKKFSTFDVPSQPNSIIRPAETVGFKELVPLSLNDRRTLNLLIANAWEKFTDHTVEHRIPVAEVKYTDKSNAVLNKTIDKLMGASVELRIRRDGQEYIRKAALLTRIDRPVGSGDAYLYYKFSESLIDAVRDSSVYARLRKELVLQISSKYALALYEIVQSLRNLKYKQTLRLSVEEWRVRLGVAEGNLPRYGNFKQRAFIPAIEELNQIGDLRIEYTEVKVGRKVVALEILWVAKTPAEITAAIRELSASRVGRSARREGRVESTVTNSESEK
jgi:hypothetical protein